MCYDGGHYSNRYEALRDGFFPLPQQNLSPLIMLLIIYTSAIPGVPFAQVIRLISDE